MTRGRPKYDDILTPREWDVLALLREGLTNQQIADRLGVSLNTSKYHVSEIFMKLGVTNREAAVAWRPERARLALLAPISMLLKHLATSTGVKVALGAAAVGVVGVFVLALGIVRQDDDDAGPLGKLAYVQAGDIWVQALPDGTARRVTTEGNASFPRWSMSGDWLLFRLSTESADIEEWVMRSDGSERRRLDAAEYSLASWSPVGGRSALRAAQWRDGDRAGGRLGASGRARTVFQPDGAGGHLWELEPGRHAHLVPRGALARHR